MIVYISESEEYTLLFSTVSGVTKCDVPQHKVLEWAFAHDYWFNAQKEMLEYVERGERTVETSVTPQMPLADSIRESNPEKLPEVEKV